MAREGAGEVPAIGLPQRLRPGSAALFNGTAGTMLELDEGNQYCRGHPAIHVVPALLAAGQAMRATGPNLLRGLVLGYEIGARVGIASKLRVTMHPHGTWGTLGAAMAVAALHGADADAMRNVINIASSLGLSTSRRTMLEGGTVRNAYAGIANQLGMLAWDLHDSGFEGERDGVATVFNDVAATDFHPEAMTDELGTRWEIARNYFKRHAACRYTHGALDAMADILAQAAGWRPRTCVASRSTPMSGQRNSTQRSPRTCSRRNSPCLSRSRPSSCMARRRSRPSADPRARIRWCVTSPAASW
jgi:2-methylcitrate dehydratase PrpD